VRDYDVPRRRVDLDAENIARARTAATDRGLEHRVAFHVADVRDWSGAAADVVVSVGTSHAWGGPAAALAALRGRVTENGLVLVGEGVWDDDPPAAAREIFGDLPDLLQLTEWASLQTSGRSTSVRRPATSSTSGSPTGERGSSFPPGRGRELADRRRVEYIRTTEAFSASPGSSSRPMTRAAPVADVGVAVAACDDAGGPPAVRGHRPRRCRRRRPTSRAPPRSAAEGLGAFFAGMAADPVLASARRWPNSSPRTA
jgi:hypothetical protein